MRLLLVFLLTITVTCATDSAVIKLTDAKSPCAEDKERLCAHIKNNEFALLLCLQKETTANVNAVSTECHQEMWTFKKNAATSKRFVDQARKMCAAEVDKNCGADSDIIACLLAYRQEIEDSQCKRYLSSMAAVFFSDYHLIRGFIESCGADVTRLHCGVVRDDPNETESSQAKVVSCLETKLKQVTAGCRKILTKKEELAADSFTLDQALYQACKDDRVQLCPDIPDHAGAVYNCLGMRKFDKLMSERCRQEVVRRQLLTLTDYKIDYGLKESCVKDLVTQHCLEERMAGALQEGFMRTVVLLQCLSQAAESQDTQKVDVSPQCMRKVKQVKRMIMGDIELTPSLGLSCHDDVHRHCGHVTPNQEGGVITCLMDTAAKKDALTKECEEEILEFVEVIDPISDYQLNYALMDNCGDYINEHCKMEQGEGEVMKCLIELELKQELRENCHHQVLSYKYFMSRSIMLDKPLYYACKGDAERLCKTEFNERLHKQSKPHGAVISCLYHHTFMDGEYELSAKCLPELRRTIIAQGESVNLAPNVVAKCADDLVKYCSGFQEGKDDYGCLQKHLIDPKYSLGEECVAEIDTYTRLVSEDVRYDYRLMKACRDVLHAKCREQLDSDTHSDLLVCLVDNKRVLKGDCKRHVKDLQLVSLYDFKFNKQFVDACNADVQQHCKYDTVGRKMSKKQDVMYCLRDRLSKEREQKVDSAVSEACKVQLRKEFIQQMADLDLDPQLLAACSRDLKNVCRLDNMSDKSEVMECLRGHEKDLTPDCREKVMVREVQQARDPGIDVTLQNRCASAIKLYCPNRPNDEVLECLESNLHQAGLGDACVRIVKHRLRSEHANIELNIQLKKACKSDITMVCRDVLTEIANGRLIQGEGEIIACLKRNYNKISVECEDHINLLREQEAADYTLDPILVKFCQTDIGEICKGLKEDEVEPCLRERLMDVKSDNCAKQVIRLITEAHADVNLDPLLLRACQKDIGYLCGRVVPGKAQIIECLQSNSLRDENALSPTCSHMLDSRVKMWSNALVVAKKYDSALEVMDDLYRAVESSQHKHELLAYFLLFMGIIVVVSFCGGRCTKRKPPSKLY